jgi:hypothetical protein
MIFTLMKMIQVQPDPDLRRKAECMQISADLEINLIGQGCTHRESAG